MSLCWNNKDWIRYAPHILTEWETCLAEGRDVEKFKDLVIAIHTLDADKERLATEAGALLTNAPIRADFDTYVEPSTLDEIRAERPAARPLPKYNLTDQQWRR